VTCPICAGFLLREPATLTCLLCGRFAVVLDATEEDRHRQRMRDIALRPRSVECDPLYNVPRPLGWIAGQLRLPGEPEPGAVRKATRG
jgi:hypothetical protein